MTALLAAKISPQEYLDQEVLSDIKHEYRQGEIITMAGGTPTHNELAGSLYSILRLALKGKPFQVFITDQRLWIPQSQSYYYPDVMIVAKPIQLLAGRKDTVTEPILIAEVLSESTAEVDKIQKFADYRQIPSFREYLLIDQNKAHAEQYTKQTTNQWLLTIWDQLEQEIQLSAVDTTFKLSELYENVQFPQL